MDGTNMAERPRHLTGKKTWPVGFWTASELNYLLTDCIPTDTIPGTWERIEVYRLRMEARQHLFHEKDAGIPDGRKPERSISLEMPEDWFMSEEEEA